jgi:hypothetical protein
VANSEDVMANLLKAVPLLPRTYIFLESTAEGTSGDFYNRWLGGVDLDDFLSGAVKLEPGQYVRVFAQWFAFSDSALRLTEEQKRDVERTIDAEEEYSGEKELIELYGEESTGVLRLGKVVVGFDVWEQLAWRRYAIRHECKRDKRNFDRDYPHSWRAAFQSSGANRFNQTGLSIIRKRMTDRTPALHGILEEARGKVAFRQTEEGESQITIFERPKVGCRYIEGVDVMTGATQTGGLDPDYHSAFILRQGFWGADGKWVRPATAARIIPCRWDIDVLEKPVWMLGRYYGNQAQTCLIAVEMNMDRGLTEYLKARGANLYLRQIFNRQEQKITGALGWQTTEKTREKLVETLARAIREWDTPSEGLDIFCPHAIEQLENFIRKPSGRCEAADGFHDDDIFGIGIPFQLIEQATPYVPDRFGYTLPPELREEFGRAPQPSAYS